VCVSADKSRHRLGGSGGGGYTYYAARISPHLALVAAVGERRRATGPGDAAVRALFAELLPRLRDDVLYSQLWPAVYEEAAAAAKAASRRRGSSSGGRWQSALRQ
jgi:hypothetical protein